MSDDLDIAFRLSNSDGFAKFQAGDGHPAMRADTALMREGAAEIRQLRRWKAEAIEVLGQWDATYKLVPERPEYLALTKASATALELTRQAQEIERLHQLLGRVEAEHRLKCVVDGEVMQDGGEAPPCPRIISNPDHMCAGCAASAFVAAHQKINQPQEPS